MRLLLVEDDKMIGKDLQKILRQGQYAVNWVQDGDTATLALETEEYDLIILDLGLPHKSGLSVLKDLRAGKNDVPVLILTARDGIADRVEGLDSGADDYMLKPFALAELEARIRSILRRKTGTASPLLTYGDILVNPATHGVVFKDKTIALSGREFALLLVLIQTPEAIFSRRQLEERLYGWNEEIASNAIEVHISQIRKKFGENIIKNIRNLGYRLAP